MKCRINRRNRKLFAPTVLLLLSLSICTGQIVSAEQAEGTEEEMEATAAEVRFARKLGEMEAEFTEAEEVYKNPSVCVTVTKKEVGDSSCLFAHILVKDPSRQIVSKALKKGFDGTLQDPEKYADKKNLILCTNGGYFSSETKNPKCAGVYIKNSRIVKKGHTNGNEICLTGSGILFTPEAGITGKELLKTGVKEIWGALEPVLIKDGVIQTESFSNERAPKTAWGMTEPGEYYALSSVLSGEENGLSYEEMADLFYEAGCTYARPLGGGTGTALVLNGRLENTESGAKTEPSADFVCVTDLEE